MAYYNLLKVLCKDWKLKMFNINNTNRDHIELGTAITHEIGLDRYNMGNRECSETFIKYKIQIKAIEDKNIP